MSIKFKFTLLYFTSIPGIGMELSFQLMEACAGEYH